MSTEHETIERLRAAMAVETRGHHLDPAAATAALQGTPRRHVPVLAVAASLVAVLVIAGGAWLLGRRDDTAPPASKPSCALDTGPLPTWARAGFSPDASDTPHVVGARGQIVAIPFVTLRAHQPAGTFNKILWATNSLGFGPLHVRATLGRLTVSRTVNLGPSYLNLPSAGCWDLQLTWQGGHDRLGLAYAP